MKSRHWAAMAMAVIVMMTIMAPPAVADSPSAGQQVFDKHCAKCHGADGAGKTTIGEKMGLKDLGSAEVQKKSDEDLAKITDEGQGKMPGFGKKLSKDDIKAVVQHMRTFKN